jgi:hypothetical protein
MMASMPPDLPMFRSAPPELFPNAAFGNRADTLAADIPAGGKTSARAIARMYAALLGEVDGVRLLPPERLAETRPDYILILPWNLKDEVIAQLAYAREWGARFVVPIPEVTVHGEEPLAVTRAQAGDDRGGAA